MGRTPEVVMILIVAKHPVRAEYVEAWPELVQEFTTATRAEPGNISFEWARSSDDPNVWLLIEAFRDSAAGEAHVASEHFKAAIAKIPGMLSGAPEIVHINGTSDGWTRMAEFDG
jgi:quinol monooxygenase YgiN